MNKFRKTGRNQKNYNDKIMYCATDGQTRDSKLTLTRVNVGNACSVLLKQRFLYSIRNTFGFENYVIKVLLTVVKTSHVSTLHVKSSTFII